MPTTMHNTASGDGGMHMHTHTTPPPQLTYIHTHIDTLAQARTQTHTHAQTLTVMGHGAVYAHIKRKSLISVTGRALAPEELANSCLAKSTSTINRACLHLQQRGENV